MSAPRLAFGCANVGIAWCSNQELDVLAETLKEVGVDILDTAARYPPTSPGLSERLLGRLSDKAFKIDTKISVKAWDGNGSMAQDAVVQSAAASLKALNISKVNTLYCHGPDRETPIAAQAATIDKIYRDGIFDHFGVSNLDKDMLEEWLKIADEKGFVKPTVYQGQYNLLCRGWEDELLPLLRRHGISFSGFSPLAGGFLTGKLTFATDPPKCLEGTRFDLAENNLMGKAFRRWYDEPSMHAAVHRLQSACERDSISIMDASLRWIAYHSSLGKDDEIVFGATTPEQIKAIARAVADGPLPEKLSEDVSRIWDGCKEYGKTIIQY